MKKIYFFLPVILLFTNLNSQNNLVDIEKASTEAEDFIKSQFDFSQTVV